MIEASLAILSVCALLVLSQLSPGPDLFLVVHTAISRSFRSAVWVVTGISAGFAIQTALVCTAGTQIMDQPWSRWLLVAAALWLLYLAWKIFPRKFGTVEIDSTPQVMPSSGTLFLQGFLCNILNVKCLLFIGGLSLGPIGLYGNDFPWFTPALAVGLVLASQFGWMLWSWLLQRHPIRAFYLRRAPLIDAAFAILLAAFAILILAGDC